VQGGDFMTVPCGCGESLFPCTKKILYFFACDSRKKQSIFTFSNNCLFIITFPNIGKLYFGFAMELAGHRVLSIIYGNKKLLFSL
jgi:hypothetical protein